MTVILHDNPGAGSLLKLLHQQLVRSRLPEGSCIGLPREAKALALPVVRSPQNDEGSIREFRAHGIVGGLVAIAAAFQADVRRRDADQVAGIHRWRAMIEVFRKLASEHIRLF